jgi:hypothetical protein
VENNKIAFNIYNDLQVAIKQQAKLFLIIGRLLRDIRDKELFKYLGEGGYDTFIHFLNNPEIGLRQSTAYLYIRIYEYYVERLRLSEEEVLEIPINRLMRLLPALKTKNDIEAKETILRIGKMTNYDSDQEIKESKLETERPLLYRHKDCGKFIFQYEELEMCKCNGTIAIVDKASSK